MHMDAKQGFTMDCLPFRFTIQNSLCLVLISLAISPSHAICLADEDSREELRDKVVAAMKLYEQGEYEKTAKAMPPYANEVLQDFFPSNFDRSVKEFQQKVTAQLGPSLGSVTLIREESSGNYYYRITFADRFENGAMALQWVFYRTVKGWKVTTFNFAPLEQVLLADEQAAANLDPKSRAIAESIAKCFSEDRNGEAIDLVKKIGTPAMIATWPKHVSEQLEIKLKSETVAGNISLNEVELVKTESAGPMLTRYHYAIRRKNLAFHIQLTTYKSNDDWKVSGLTLSNDTPPTFVAVRNTHEPMAR